MQESQLLRWIESARNRGQAPALLTLLDALEPTAPLLASGLLVAQPFASLCRAGDACRELADLLEAPEGLRQLRDSLADEATE